MQAVIKPGIYIKTSYTCPGSKTVVWETILHVERDMRIPSYNEGLYRPAPQEMEHLPSGTEVARQVHFCLKGGVRGGGLTLGVEYDPIEFKQLTPEQVEAYKKTFPSLSRGEGRNGIHTLWDVPETTTI